MQRMSVLHFIKICHISPLDEKISLIVNNSFLCIPDISDWQHSNFERKPSMKWEFLKCLLQKRKEKRKQTYSEYFLDDMKTSSRGWNLIKMVNIPVHNDNHDTNGDNW